MTTAFDRFVAGVLDALIERRFEFETALLVGADPEDGESRIELHVLGAPDVSMREIETRAIDLLIELEDRIPGVSSIAFVHPPDLAPIARSGILQRSRARFSPPSVIATFTHPPRL